MLNHFRADMKRPLIGVGHSMGGNNLVNLSLMHPRLFTTLVLIDPAIQRMPSKVGNFLLPKSSTNRRDRWPSRQAAQASYKRSKFYQAWDPRVLDLLLKHGLRDLPTDLYPDVTPASATAPVIGADSSTATVSPEPSTEKEVTLTTTKHQEVLTFLRPNFATKENPSPADNPNPVTHPDVDPDVEPHAPFYSPVSIATFFRLPFLRPSVLYIFGGQSELSAPASRADKLATTGTGVGGSGGFKKGRVQQHTFPDVGHLIPMEIATETADVCAAWIAPEIERWRAVEEAERREWAAVPRERRARLSEEYVRTINSDQLASMRNKNRKEGGMSSKL